jgi:hypothetical protein
MICTPHLVFALSVSFVAGPIAVAADGADEGKKAPQFDAGPLASLDPYTAIPREEFDKKVAAIGRPGVPKDLAKADALAAEAEKKTEDLSVLRALALSYRKYDGDVPDKHVERAVELARRGANRGDAVCECLVGLYIFTGLQKKPDNVEAMKWFLLSAAHGFAAGKRNALMMTAFMTRNDVLSAKSRARAVLSERARPAGSTPRPYPEVIFKQRPKSDPEHD